MKKILLKPKKKRSKNVIIVAGKLLRLNALYNQMREDFKDRNW